MTAHPTPGAGQPANPTLGIALKCASVLVFVGMQTAIKFAGAGVPAGEVAFFRSFFALIPVLAYLLWLGELRTALRTSNLAGHFVRGGVGVLSMTLGFFALTRLPYPEWIAITYATPILTVGLAALFLHEVVRAYRWSAVAVGLLGVLVVLAPRLSVFSEGAGPGPLGVPTIGALAAIASAAVAAVAMIQIRRLVRTESTATIVVYFSLTSSGIALATLVFGWVVPSPKQAVWLVLAGILGGVGQLLLTSCYRYADTSTIAPFEYTSLVLAVAIGAVLFDETVSATTLVGGVIVIGAGVFIVWRERRLGIEQSKARGAAAPNG